LHRHRLYVDKGRNRLSKAEVASRIEVQAIGVWTTEETRRIQEVNLDDLIKNRFFMFFEK